MQMEQDRRAKDIYALELLGCVTSRGLIVMIKNTLGGSRTVMRTMLIGAPADASGARGGGQHDLAAAPVVAVMCAGVVVRMSCI